MNLYEEMKSARMIAMKTHNKNESNLLSVLNIFLPKSEIFMHITNLVSFFLLSLRKHQT